MPPHPCLPNWGAEPIALSNDLEELNRQRPCPWAHQLDDRAAYDALLALEQALFAAVGGTPPNPRPFDDSRAFPSGNLRQLADATRGQLQADRPLHGPPPPPWWLEQPPSDPARVADAESLYGRVRNALEE